MSKIHSYTIRLPYATCEDLLNNETVSEAIAKKRALQRTVKWRTLDGKSVNLKTVIDALKPGQIFKERAGIVSTKAGKLQKAYGFESWTQDFKIKKTGANTAECVDSISWPKNGASAYRAYTLRGSGDAAVVMSCNPWVINLDSLSIFVRSMIRSRMEPEMQQADAEFPQIAENAARTAHKPAA